MGKSNYSPKKAALKRFLRVYLPQVPATIVLVGQQVQVFNLPEWVAPSLIFIGAVATALDKLLRALKVY